MCESGPPSLSLGRLTELWRVIRMCEGGPPALSLGRLAERWRVIRMWPCFVPRLREYEGCPRRAILDWEKQTGRG